MATCLIKRRTKTHVHPSVQVGSKTLGQKWHIFSFVVRIIVRGMNCLRQDK
ncbi:hypothetical protein HanRHA438_Chr11g0485111 [Helianthus annuus]|nr:hypothetical protein HanRHA438_Chr11g0485111 [Helianthus annuus]